MSTTAENAPMVRMADCRDEEFPGRYRQMKTAILTLDGVLQIVLTPETEHEKMAVNMFKDNEGKAIVLEGGEFFDCQGGWTRLQMSDGHIHSGGKGRSLFIRLEQEEGKSE